MNLSSPSLRRTTMLVPCLLAFAWLGGACGSASTTTPPTDPTPDASNPDPVPDVQTPPPPELDAGSLACGMNSCASRVVGGQLGAACCAGTGGMNCGLNFGQGCIDQSDAGFTPPNFDAATVVPDPSCGTVSIDFNGMSFMLSGCCLPSRTCGYYVPQMMSIGCLTTDQLRAQGASVPDAPIPCSADGGQNP